MVALLEEATWEVVAPAVVVACEAAAKVVRVTERAAAAMAGGVWVAVVWAVATWVAVVRAAVATLEAAARDLATESGQAVVEQAKEAVARVAVARAAEVREWAVVVRAAERRQHSSAPLGESRPGCSRTARHEDCHRVRSTFLWSCQPS